LTSENWKTWDRLTYWSAERPNDEKKKDSKSIYASQIQSCKETDASSAKGRLEAKGGPKDPNTQKMLSLVDKQLSRRKAKSHS
jgi:hypothetical protein